MEFLIVSGLSGAGKSTVMSILEDSGFFCVDNLPPVLIPKFAEVCLAGAGTYERVAMVCDIRAGEQFDGLFQAMDTLNQSGSLSFEVEGATVELGREDLLIDTAQKPGYVSQENGSMTVVLDTNLTEALIEEGYVYEIISKIQTMRKEAGFEVMDRIRVSVNGNGKLADVAFRNREAVCGKVLALELAREKKFSVSREWNINGERAVISMEKV